MSREIFRKLWMKLLVEFRSVVGRKNKVRVDHNLFDDPDWNVFIDIGKQEHDRLKKLALDQLGTVGAGNHFVDLFVEEKTGDVWVANHFGSRGFGHKTASGFLNLANDRGFSDRAPGESMEQAPTLIDLDSELGDMYYRAMKLAGKYAYAGQGLCDGRSFETTGGYNPFLKSIIIITLLGKKII